MQLRDPDLKKRLSIKTGSSLAKKLFFIYILDMPCKVILSKEISSTFRWIIKTRSYCHHHQNLNYNLRQNYNKSSLQYLVLKPYREELKATIKSRGIKPKLVGFLANEDPAAVKYAESTSKTCEETGVTFELRKCDKEQLEDQIVEANEDDSIHGIMIYYPVFGDRQDQYLQNVVSASKDVEGLCHKYIYNMYHNKRYLDEKQTKKCIIPCTPLAIVKVLEYIGVYNSVLPYGDRLHGRVITIINRSEIVGRPLAALLANDGGKVYSVDINNIQEFHRGTGLKLKKHEVRDTNLKIEEILPFSDVVVTGVPTPSYKVPTDLLRDGVVAINFSAFKNFNDNIKEKASIYVPAVGKVTIAMLERNLLRLYDYHNYQS